jgi:hypothetical protein
VVIVATKYDKNKKKKQPKWVFSDARREALKKAQKVHVILINIGKKYRNKAIRQAQYKKVIK